MGVVLLLSVVALPRLRRYATIVVPALAVVLAAILLSTHVGRSILHQLRLTGNTQSTNGSNYQRTVAKHVAEAQISDRPVAGFGFSVDNDAQNIYLQILAAGGVITMCGFAVFVGGLATCLRRAWHGPLRDAAIAIGVCGIGYLINGYYDAQIADKYLYVLPGILFACARVTSALRADRLPATTVPAAAPGPAPQPILTRGSPALR
jgi:O-antigen ligase